MPPHGPLLQRFYASSDQSQALIRSDVLLNTAHNGGMGEARDIRSERYFAAATFGLNIPKIHEVGRVFLSWHLNIRMYLLKYRRTVIRTSLLGSFVK